MNALVTKKFDKFIYYPDLANKFLFTSISDIILSRKFNIYLKYIFSQQRNYNYIALKALMMLTSVFPKRCLMSSRLIVLKYTKSRSHSCIYLTLTLDEFIPTINLFMIHPIKPITELNGHIKESKHFIFPGFIKHLRLPRWEHGVNISFDHNTSRSSYPLFFHKTAYID
jgi:hypothetical protein